MKEGCHIPSNQLPQGVDNCNHCALPWTTQGLSTHKNSCGARAPDRQPRQDRQPPAERPRQQAVTGGALQWEAITLKLAIATGTWVPTQGKIYQDEETFRLYDAGMHIVEQAVHAGNDEQALLLWVLLNQSIFLLPTQKIPLPQWKAQTASRLRQFRDGHWEVLRAEVDERAAKARESFRAASNDVAAAEKLVADGSISRAITRIDPTTGKVVKMESEAQLKTNTTRSFPTRTEEEDHEFEDLADTARADLQTQPPSPITHDELRDALPKSSKGAAPGPWGIRMEHIALAIERGHGDFIAHMINALTLGATPLSQELHKHLATSRALFLSKDPPSDSTRPIMMGCPLLRLGCRVLARRLKLMGQALAKRQQFGVGAQDGALRMAYTTQASYLSGDHAVVQLDESVIVSSGKKKEMMVLDCGLSWCCRRKIDEI